MRLLPALLLLLSPAVLASPARAAGPLDPVARYLEEDTLLVVCVDLARVDLQQALAWLNKASRQSAPDPRDLETPERIGRILIDHGGGRVFVLWSLSDAIRQAPPVLLAPVDSPAEAIAQLHEAFPDQARARPLQSIGNCLAVGPEETLRRIAAAPAADRPLLIEAAASVGDRPHFAVASLPADVRKVLAQSLPDLPAEYGGARGSALAGSMQWVAASLRTPPEPAVELRVRGVNTDSAAALLKTIRTALPEFNTQLAALLEFKQEGEAVTLSLDDENHRLTAVASLLPGVRLPAAGGQDSNRLKHVALAFHNYYDTYKTFPPFANGDAAGEPLLSWRVHLLPYLDQAELYRQFRLDEPWDSDHNRRLIDQMPDVYRISQSAPNEAPAEAGRTRIQTPLMAGSLLGDAEVPKFGDIQDGTANTILVLVTPADRAVVWTKPDDIRIDPETPLKGLMGAEGLLTAFCDGSVRILPADLTPQDFKAYLTKAGGEVVP